MTSRTSLANARWYRVQRPVELFGRLYATSERLVLPEDIAAPLLKSDHLREAVPDAQMAPAAAGPWVTPITR